LEGGPGYVVSDVLLSLVSRGLGGPGSGGLAVAVALLGLSLFAVGMARMIRDGEDAWVFFAVAVLASPLLVLILPPPFLFERYFALPWVFFLLVVGEGWRECVRLSDPGERSPSHKEDRFNLNPPTALNRFAGWSALLLPLLFLVGSIWTALDFHRHQRGRLREAIAWIAAQPMPPTVAGDDDFRIRAVLGYHDKEGRLTFVPRGAIPPGGASWLLVHYQDGSFAPPDEAEDGDGNLYERAAGWPSQGPADWGWFVFRNAGRKKR
ncbi:MAG: hypothetical protein K2W96_14220, partial [Gemmataceae bacterium]|nr:hypothetical protein [Gemmataceae bacterium]